MEPENVSQRIVMAGLEYEKTRNIDSFIGELIVCICDLDLASMANAQQDAADTSGKDVPQRSSSESERRSDKAGHKARGKSSSEVG